MQLPIEFFIGRIRALSLLLTSKSLIGFEGYVSHLEEFARQLILTTKNIKKVIVSPSDDLHFQDKDELVFSLSKIEEEAYSYLELLSSNEENILKIADVTSEKIANLMEALNQFINGIRSMDGYQLSIEEIYFVKNKLIETEKIEKELTHIIKALRESNDEKENRIIYLEKQLDIAENKVFNLQAKVSHLNDEIEELQNRIQELINEKTQQKVSSTRMIEFENLISENQQLKEKIRELTDKIASEGGNKNLKTEIEDYKQKIENLKSQLKLNEEAYNEKIQRILEERNVWRSKAMQNLTYTLEESVALLKEQLRRFEEENRKLLNERNTLAKKLEEMSNST